MTTCFICGNPTSKEGHLQTYHPIAAAHEAARDRALAKWARGVYVGTWGFGWEGLEAIMAPDWKEEG